MELSLDRQDGETTMENREKDSPRLIEHAFPLKQTSLDSVHEKNVRHGHISTLHIWPARRPLAACRAALIATLLPDPGTPEKRKELCEKIGGRIVKKIERKKMPNGEIVEREKEVTEGGILHWGRETENKETLEWFRQEIRKAYGGRAPKVLDPFAGGGAIPLEAMRLGCEATASDINSVAWFILKCTLEYPQKLAGKTYPLPDFILENEEFMHAFFKAKGLRNPATEGRELFDFATEDTESTEKTNSESSVNSVAHLIQADLAWHVRAWGQWVLDHARRELARYYPTYADFEPWDLRNPSPYEKQPIRLVPLKDDGTADVDALNAECSKEYLAEKRNPRWIAKPPVAYLWARTVKCKNCRATLPLLKTRWLCKKDKKRVLLTMEPNPDNTGVVFGIETNVPAKGGNTAQRREHDKRIGAGTMSKSGAKCPCCSATMTKKDLQVEGRADNIGLNMTAVIVEGRVTKEYRLPTAFEHQIASEASEGLSCVFEDLPGGIPDEPLQPNAKGDTWCIGYGKDIFRKLFTERQLLCLGTFARTIRAVSRETGKTEHELLLNPAVLGFLYCCLARLADRNSQVCTWQVGADKIGHTFTRYALSFTWDFVEVMPWADSSGGFGQAIDWVARVVEHALEANAKAPTPTVAKMSAIGQSFTDFDLVITDPPYYDAIGYSVVMDFFSVWLRRTLTGLLPNAERDLGSFSEPKWNHQESDGELVDDAERHGGDKYASKRAYEEGMARAFLAAHRSLAPNARMVIVFAHKEPDAWETLVSAIIRAGFVVDGSWPIMTERSSRMRSMGSAALSSSVWLVCKKRLDTARPGWDNQVLDEMRRNIAERLREFWDAGIRGPDFVWAATGPALEAYSKHPVVKKANEPGPMTVSEFLTHVRRMVVDFVVGRVFSATEGTESTEADFSESSVFSVADLDSPTAYYLLHRHDFGMDEAPAGACILYAISCGISDKELASTWDLIGFTKGKATEDTESTEDDDSISSADSVAEEEEESGSKVKLKTWAQRKSRSLGYEAPGGKPVPLIDRVHCLMHMWRAGDVSKVDEYLDSNGLRRQELFKRLLQSLIELSPHGSDERPILESISNHVQARGAVEDRQAKLFATEVTEHSEN